MAAEATAPDAEAGTVVEDAQRDLLALTSYAPGRRGPVSAAEGVEALAPLLESLLAGETGLLGLSTGYPDLDRMTRGLRPGELVLIGGRPSMGKTSLATNIAVHVAQAGQPVLLLSLEMRRDDVWLRMLAAEARIDFHALMSGAIRRESEIRRLSDAIGTLAALPLYVDDDSQTLFELRASCRRVQMRQTLGLVLLDYLQLIPSPPDAENRNLALAEISRGLKGLAKELDVPVVALSQLSREPARRGGDHRPVLSDLRESGALEQDADGVWFVHRPEVYTPTDDDLRGLAEVVIAKARNGPTGIVPLTWRGDLMRFENRSRRGEEPDDPPAQRALY